jgi:hypothetical protein
VADGPPARRGAAMPWRSIGLVVAVGLLALVVLFRSVRTDYSSIGATVGVAMPIDRQPTFHSFRIPAGFEDVVSTVEPQWVALAQQDAHRARAELVRHIERLRQRAPLDVRTRSRASELPEFSALSFDPGRYQSLQAEIERFLATADYDDDQARLLLQYGPPALALAAERLRSVAWSERTEVERAERLHRWLCDSTGCRDLEFEVDGHLSPGELAFRNRQIGELWTWFVNEFAHTERTWEAFRSLMPPR